MADVAQLVRALVCGTRCREFESHYPPHLKKMSEIWHLFFVISWNNWAGEFAVEGWIKDKKD